MIRRDSELLFGSLAAAVVLAACNGWPTGTAPDPIENPGVTYSCHRVCQNPSTGEYGEFITGVACVSGPFDIEAAAICNGGAACVAGGVENFPDGFECGPATAFFLTPLYAECAGPCSPGMLTRTISQFEIALDPVRSYISFVDFNHVRHPDFALTGTLNIDGGDCAPGTHCNVTIQGMDVAGTGSIAIKGVTYSNPHVYLLGPYTTDATAIGADVGWVAGPGMLRAEVNAFETDHNRYRAFPAVHTYTPASFTMNRTTGTFSATINFTDELGDDIGIHLTGQIANHPPEPVASISVSGTTCGDATVHLDSSSSFDPNGNDTIFDRVWVEHYGTPTETVLSHETVADVHLPAGTHEITLVVLDEKGAFKSTTQSISIAAAADTTPPVIVINDESLCAWAPNHKWISLPYAGDLVSDDCDASPTVEVRVSSNEPVDDTGDGSTSPDWIVGSEGLCLRAERSGHGAGRVYTIEVIATDDAGNSSTATRTVSVPHDNRNHGQCAGHPVADCPFEPAPQDAPTVASCAVSSGHASARGYLFATIMACAVALLRARKRTRP